MTTNTLPKPLETDIQKAIIDMLRHHPSVGIVWRMNTGAQTVKATDTSKRRFIRFGPKGHADIVGILRPCGRFFAIEVKRPGKQPTPEQTFYLDAVAAAGGVAGVASSVDGAMAIIGGA